jgi:hypothetical protein
MEKKGFENGNYSNILQNVRMFCVGKLREGVSLVKGKGVSLLRENGVSLVKRLKERKFERLREAAIANILKLDREWFSAAI